MKECPTCNAPIVEAEKNGEVNCIFCGNILVLSKEKNTNENEQFNFQKSFTRASFFLERGHYINADQELKILSDNLNNLDIEEKQLFIHIYFINIIKIFFEKYYKVPDGLSIEVFNTDLLETSKIYKYKSLEIFFSKLINDIEDKITCLDSIEEEFANHLYNEIRSISRTYISKAILFVRNKRSFKLITKYNEDGSYKEKIALSAPVYISIIIESELYYSFIDLFIFFSKFQINKNNLLVEKNNLLKEINDNLFKEFYLDNPHNRNYSLKDIESNASITFFIKKYKEFSGDSDVSLEKLIRNISASDRILESKKNQNKSIKTYFRKLNPFLLLVIFLFVLVIIII